MPKYVEYDTVHIDSICIGTDNIMLSSEWRYTVTKTFGGLVIFCAIAGNITSYSREIFAQLNSLLYYGLFPAIAKICPSFVFPAVAGWYISQVQPVNCSSF